MMRRGRSKVRLAESRVLARTSVVWLWVVWGWLPTLPPLAQEIEAFPPDRAAALGDGEQAERLVYRCLVPLPLAESDERRLKQQWQQLLDQQAGGGRPVVVLEFQAKEELAGPAGRPDSAIGRGTPFERSLSLARWLISPTGARIRSIAYLPRSIEGHAVLIALACEEIAMAPLAEIGRVAVEDEVIDPLVVEGYLAIARRRQLFPVDAVRSMLDRDITLFQADLVDAETVFVQQAELERLREAGKVLAEKQLSIPGQLGNFVGQEARGWRWITQVAQDEKRLQELLGVTAWKEPRQRLNAGPPRPLVIEIRGAINEAAANRWMRLISEAMQKEDIDLMVFSLRSPGGDLEASLRLANYIADIDDTRWETLAWVDGEARGDAALIALACDRLLLRPRSVLGGPGEASISAPEVRRRRLDWEGLAAKTGRPESHFYALLTPDLQLREYTNQRGQKLLGDDELFAQRPDFAAWKGGRGVRFPLGMSAEEGIQRQWWQQLVADQAGLANELGVERLPEPQRVTPWEQWLRHLADQEWLATMLITMAMILFMNELTTPGLGVAGFLALICMLLFFWMRFLNGTAEWLEVILCLGGIFCLGLEFFVLPGFGIFGFGGFAMLVAGIILSSQTFIIPSNDYQWSKLAVSTGQIAIALGGLLATLYLLRNQLEHLPMIRMLKLEPQPEPLGPERLDLRQMVGKRGVVTARCAPIGTALIEGRYWDIHSPDALLEPATPIVVSEVRGKNLYVESLPG
jgi:membrane-bound serine protease (ClpP class)